MWHLLMVVVPRPLLVPCVLCAPRVPSVLMGGVAIHTPRTIIPHPCHQVLPCLPRHVLATVRQGLGLQLHCEAGVGTVGRMRYGGSGCGDRWCGGGYNGGAGVYRYCTSVSQLLLHLVTLSVFFYFSISAKEN